MKEYVYYYYNMDVDTINNNDNYYSFFHNGNLYYFVYFNRTIEELNDLININLELKNKGINVHDIIMNKFNYPLSKIGELTYVLLKINGQKDELVDIFTIANMNNKLVLNNKTSKLYRNNWGELWSKKIDYLENQISELGKNKLIILDSFGYYVGLAENAISYVNRANEVYANDYHKICLSHRRIFYPNTILNYYNPLSFIFDLEERDVAEYLKYMFFYGDEAFQELCAYLKITTLNTYGYHMLYARLLYPSYYFDLFEEVMNNNKDENDLLKIIDKVNDYELFLKNVYKEISKYTNLDKINWLIKKEL